MVIDPGILAGKTSNARRSMYAQLLATLIQTWLTVGVGMEIAIPTLIVGKLHNKPDQELNMNDSQASWFGGLPSVTYPIGSLLAGYVQERFGRKGSMLMVNIPIFIGWITLHLASSIWALYAGITIIGLASGLSEASCHSYTGEIGDPRLRGTLSVITTAALSVSQLLMYAIGYWFSWRTTAAICATVPVFAFLSMTQIPESPTWLVRKNRLEDAERSLCWLRGWVKPEDVQEEFNDLVKYAQNSTTELPAPTPDTVQSTEKEGKKDGVLKTKFKELTDKKLLRPLRMVFIAFSISMTSSLLCLKPFLLRIFEQVGTPDAGVVLIIYGVVYVLGMMANIVFLRHFGKRKLALYSMVAVTLSLVLLAVYCEFYFGPSVSRDLYWIPVVFLLINKFFSGVGVVPLPWQLISEVFPIVGRTAACGVAGAWAHVVIFAGVKSFLPLEKLMSFSGVMYLYGLIAVLGTIYFYFYLPETEGKSLEQIEKYFTKDHDRKEKFTIGTSERKDSNPGHA